MSYNASTEHKPILAERFKTKMCQNHEKNGSCPYEARCMFAHGEQDLRTKQMNLTANLVTEEAIKNFLSQRMAAARTTGDSKVSILAERFKTKMCQNYEKHGSCPYEARCMFAHGEQELRTTEMNMTEKLTTDEAIKAFQRNSAANKKKSVKSPVTKAPVKAASAEEKMFVSVSRRNAVSVSPLPIAMDSYCSSPASATPRKASLADDSFDASSEVKSPSSQSAPRVRHDPYAPVAFGQRSASSTAWSLWLQELNAPCRCESCVSPLAAAMARKDAVVMGVPQQVVLLA
jgi:hypothetical protein